MAALLRKPTMRISIWLLAAGRLVRSLRCRRASSRGNLGGHRTGGSTGLPLSYRPPHTARHRRTDHLGALDRRPHIPATHGCCHSRSYPGTNHHTVHHQPDTNCATHRGSHRPSCYRAADCRPQNPRPLPGRGR